MKDGGLLTLILALLAASSAPPHAWSGPTEDAVLVEVYGGMAAFDVGTNILAISVRGKSNALEARVRVRQGKKGIVLEQIEATVPVKSLNTGINLRNEHMRKYVFTTSDGHLPDVRFSAEKAECSSSGAPGQQVTCQLTGELAIRGTPRPLAIVLTLTDEGGTFRAVGEGVVKLSAYGIEQPSWLGVRPADDVKLQLKFTARKPARVTLQFGS